MNQFFEMQNKASVCLLDREAESAKAGSPVHAADGHHSPFDE